MIWSTVKNKLYYQVSQVRISRRFDFPGFLTTTEESASCQHNDKQVDKNTVYVNGSKIK